jgi:hypothetical protein
MKGGSLSEEEGLGKGIYSGMNTVGNALAHA